jgi:hypothetical protein
MLHLEEWTHCKSHDMTITTLVNRLENIQIQSTIRTIAQQLNQDLGKLANAFAN